MNERRRVRLRLEDRVVTVRGDHEPETLTYAGIAVVRLEGARVVEEVWVPLGEDPSMNDDEALIAEWRTALTWSWSPVV